MSISKEQVKYIAHLARLRLTEKELDTFAVQLEKIVEYIDQLKLLDVTNIAPMEHVLLLRNVKRPDNLAPSLDVKDVLKNAPEKKDNFFKLPKVIE